jgi:hypothetical protein
MENGPEVGMTILGIGMVVLIVGPILLPIIIGLFKPGRRGRMTTTMEVEHPGVDMEETVQIYVERLAHEKFRVVREGNTLVANRGKSPCTLDIATHAQKPLQLEIRFSEIEDGVKAHLKMWMTDFVVHDTGEGQFIDLMLNRLVSDDLANVPPPIVSNLSLKAAFAFYSVIFMIIGALLLPFLSFDQAVQMLAVLATATLVTIAMSLLGLYDVYMKPKEMSGKREALLGLVGCILVFLMSTAIFAMKHGGEIQKWIEKARNARKEAALLEVNAPTRNHESANPLYHCGVFDSELKPRSG